MMIVKLSLTKGPHDPHLLFSIFDGRTLTLFWLKSRFYLLDYELRIAIVYDDCTICLIEISPTNCLPPYNHNIIDTFHLDDSLFKLPQQKPTTNKSTLHQCTNDRCDFICFITRTNNVDTFKQQALNNVKESNNTQYEYKILYSQK